MHPQAPTTKIDTKGKDTLQAKYPYFKPANSHTTVSRKYQNSKKAKKKKKKIGDKIQLFTPVLKSHKKKRKKEKEKAKRPTNAFFPQI